MTAKLNTSLNDFDENAYKSELASTAEVSVDAITLETDELFVEPLGKLASVIYERQASC